MKKIKWLAVLASLLCGAVFAETTTPDGETAEGDGANSSGTINLCVGDVFNVYENHGSAYTLSLKSNSDSTVALGEVAGSSVKAGKFYTITAKKAGNTTIVFNNKKNSGTTYTATFTVKVSEARVLEPGAQTTVSGWGNENEPGSSTWTQSVDPSVRVTVTFGTRTTTSMTATLTAGQTEGDVKVTIKNVNSNSGSEYVYAVKIEKSREKHNEAISVAVDETTSVTATSDGASAWGISSADTTIATVDPTKIAATESATFEVAGVKVGDTTVAATNAAAIWNYAVTVYNTNTVDLVVTNGTPRTVTCTSEKAATWSVASSDTGVATVSGSSATATINATVTGVSLGDAVITVSNKYQITTVNVRVVEVKEDEKEIPLSGGGTVVCESPVKAVWTATYDDTIIKSVGLKSLDPVTLFALSMTQDGPIANKVEVTVEPREGLDAGTTTEVFVSNGYTTYTLKLTITKTTETQTLCLANGTAQTNALSGVEADYKVNSADTAIATAEIEELEDKTNLVITALKVGNTKVTVDGPEKTIIYNVVVSQVTIEKTVLPWNNVKSEEHYKADDLSNATIRVATHVEYTKDVYTNKILYISSTCNSHTLEKGKVVRALNNLKDKGNVKWALFGARNSVGGIEATGAADSGELTYQQTDITEGFTSATFNGGMHRNLKAYLTYLNNNVDADHKNFDYIVLSFDGSRLAIDYSNDNASLNASVAGKLRWYYENKRILWIVDSPNTNDPAAQQFEPKEYYHPVSLNDDNNNWNMPPATWEAMVALLDPATYLDKSTGSRYNSSFNSRGTHSGTRTYEVRRIEEQASYEKSEDVAKLLDDNIKPVRYDAQVLDKVQTSVGELLTIPNGASSVRFYQWMNASAPSTNPIADDKKDNDHWKLVTPNPVKLEANNQVSVMVSNVTENAYMMLEVDIRMAEGFLDAAKKKGPPLCTWDDVNKVWKIDPNDGPAELVLTRIVEGEETQVCARGSAATEAQERWPVPADPIVIAATDYFDVYDGEEHSIDFTVNPATNPDTLKDTQVRFSTDNSTWTDWTNYTDRAKICPTWTDCCWSNKVYIEARCVPGYADTNALAYVTITQRVVRIQANDATKTYDGEPLTNNTFTVLSGFVDGEGFADNKTTMSASSTRTDAGTADNEITKVGGSYQLNYKSNTKALNYTIETVKGTLTINKRQINATASPAVKVYDGTPTGITVTVSNVIDKDKANIRKTYYPYDPANPPLTSAPGGEFNADKYNSYTNVYNNEQGKTVWCKVEILVGDNYLPKTVNSTVTITRRPILLSTEKVDVTVPYDQVATFTEGDIEDVVGTVSKKTYLGYVSGEQFTYSNIATNSTPGTTKDATFSYAANESILANNYTVTQAYGTLRVEKEPPEPCAEPVCVTAYTLKFSGKTAGEYRKDKKTSAYKAIQKISGKGELIFDGDTVVERFTKMKVGKKALADFAAEADLYKCSYFGSNLGAVTSTFGNVLAKPGKTYSCESDIGLSIEDAESADFDGINVEQVAFGKLKVKIVKGGKKGCGEIEGCVPELTPGSYSGWFTGSANVGCLEEADYEDKCNELDNDDSIAIFGGTWSVKYSSSQSTKYGRHPELFR